jgi:hypothetical protein
MIVASAGNTVLAPRMSPRLLPGTLLAGLGLGPVFAPALAAVIVASLLRPGVPDLSQNETPVMGA